VRLKPTETLRVWHFQAAVIFDFPLQSERLDISSHLHPLQRMLEAVRLKGGGLRPGGGS
jgi:hypothetical protein